MEGREEENVNMLDVFPDSARLTESLIYSRCFFMSILDLLVFAG